MLKINENKNLMLLYAVFGFGSIALVALGELPALDARSDLFRFYIKLIFGGFLIFYSVLIHFALLPLARKLDKTGPRYARLIFGESSSLAIVVALMLSVLIYWIIAFSELLRATGFSLL